MPTLNSCFTQGTLNFLASSNWQKQRTEVFYKKAVLKHFAILTGKHCVGVYFWQNCLPLGLQLYQKGNPIQVFFCWEIFKKICFKECFWTDFRRWLFGTLFLDSCFQNHPGYYKNTSRFRTRALTHSSAHMLSLYLTPTLSFEPMLVTYVHPWRLIHRKQTLVVLGILVFPTHPFTTCFLYLSFGLFLPFHFFLSVLISHYHCHFLIFQNLFLYCFLLSYPVWPLSSLSWLHKLCTQAYYYLIFSFAVFILAAQTLTGFVSFLF